MDQVEEVKQKTDIVALINDFVPLNKAGKNFKGLCPFHSEKTPSFMVSPQLQSYKCFGCSEGGDAITFLQRHEGMEFYEALKFLADRVGIKLKPFKGRDLSEKERLYAINHEAVRFYHYILIKHAQGKKALAYLTKQRGLTASTLDTFQIGFSPPARGALVSFLTKKKGFKVEDIEKAGLVYRSSGKYYDRFNARVVFPIFDHRGNPVGFGGRILPGDKRDTGKYINSPDTLVYKKSLTLYGLASTKGEIKRAGKAILVEGEFDLLSPFQVGVTNIAAIKGTALTEDQVRILSRYANEVVFAFDSDSAGVKAIMRGIQMADQLGLQVKVMVLGKYKDPDDFVRSDKPKFLETIKHAKEGWDFAIDAVYGKYDATSGEGKAKISREIIPFLASISDKIVQAHYINKLATLLRVPPEAVSQQIDAINNKTKSSLPTTFAKESVRDSVPTSERQSREAGLLSLIFEEPSKVNVRLKEVVTKIKSSVLTKLAAAALAYSTKNEFTITGFNSSLPEELRARFADLIMSGQDMPSKAWLEREIAKQIGFLDELGKKEDIGELAKNEK